MLRYWGTRAAGSPALMRVGGGHSQRADSQLGKRRDCHTQGTDQMAIGLLGSIRKRGKSGENTVRKKARRMQARRCLA